MTASTPTPLSPPASFEAALAELGVQLEQNDAERLGLYLALLYQANATTNLTAIRDPDEAWTKHIFDALTLLPVLQEVPVGDGQARRLLDVGTGGGVPGLPLAIALPDWRFTLLDATQKKCEFLRVTADAIGLTNVDVVQARCEQAGHDRGRIVDEGGVRRREGALRASFDVVTARALGRVAVAAELTVPFAVEGGLVLLIKGQKADEELAEAKAALHLLHTHHAGTVDTPTGRIVVLEKQRTTPKSYPRRDGEPKRSPLGVSKDAAAR
ncbi:MAG: 16S rRNA (guanine(527)-N(7))-methyltransferase RsmG [Planctomycetota bacterium]